MSKKAVEETFGALFGLTDLRGIYRETAPSHELSDEQKERVKDILEKVRKSLDIIEGELIE